METIPSILLSHCSYLHLLDSLGQVLGSWNINPKHLNTELALSDCSVGTESTREVRRADLSSMSVKKEVGPDKLYSQLSASTIGAELCSGPGIVFSLASPV